VMIIYIDPKTTTEFEPRLSSGCHDDTPLQIIFYQPRNPRLRAGLLLFSR
jgi:hypothetical protein